MAPKRGDLLNAMLDQDSSEALQLTCEHLICNSISVMEEDWIALTALIGKTSGMPFGDLWNTVNVELLRLVNADTLKVNEAIMCTTKLMLLYKRSSALHPTKLMHMSALRSKVIDNFPEKGTLSTTGLVKYARILPSTEANPESVDILVYCHRILAGFSKLFAEERFDDLKQSLEFISKKKATIPMNVVWPCPDEEEALRGDICWFLWGMLVCYYGNDRVSPYLELFSHNWRRAARNERIGLLYGFPYILDTNVTSDWTYAEKTILEKVNDSIGDMWTQFTESVNDDDEKEKEKDKDKNKNKSKDSMRSDTEERLDVLTSFIPRTTDYTPYTYTCVPVNQKQFVQTVRSLQVEGRVRNERHRDRESFVNKQQPHPTATDTMISQFDNLRFQR